MSVKTIPLGELVKVVGGYAFKSEDFSSEGFPVVRISDIRNGNVDLISTAKIPAEKIGKGSQYRIQPGDILIAMSGATTGKIGIVPENSLTEAYQNQRVGNFKILKEQELNKSYLKHFILSPIYQSQIWKTVVGVAQPNISSSQLESFPIPLPPLAEQKRIAAVLDKADAVREKRRLSIKKLDSLLQSVFLDMFGDPVSNPKGWEVKPLKQCAALLTGFAFKSNQYVKDVEQIKLCRGANVLPDKIDWSDVVYWEKEKAVGLERYVLEKGDIVIAMDRPWISSGFKIAQIKEVDLPSLLVQRVTRVRANNNLSNDYLFQVLKHDAFVRHCKPTETTVPHISPLEISSFEIPIPELAEIKKYSEISRKLKDSFIKQQHSLIYHENIFQSLQQRAFAGELFGAADKPEPSAVAGG